MAKKIILPKFLLTMEVFNEIKEPPLKNPKYQEISYKIQNPEVISLLKKEGSLLRARQTTKTFKDYCCNFKQAV
jgi:hypothetical protein